MKLHFWTTVDPELVRDWSPQHEPWRFRDGRSHALFELHAEARSAGVEATIGRFAPKGSVTVFYLGDAYSWSANTLMQGMLDRVIVGAARSSAMVAIRGDVPADIVTDLPDVEIVGSQAAEHRLRTEGVQHRIVTLPPLPQRAIMPRDPARFGRVRRVVLKSNHFNLPPWVVSDGFRDELKRLGLELEIDAPTADRAPTWNDFSEADVALCLRQPVREAALAAKPPTKLINAWAAGVIPIVDDQPSFLELATDGSDALVASSPDETLEALRRLTDEPSLVALLEAGARERSEHFSRPKLVDAWLSTLHGVEASVARRTRQVAVLKVIERIVRGAPASIRARVRGAR